MFWFAGKLMGGIALVAAAIYGFIVHQNSFGKGLTTAEMDWDGDGATSLGEIIGATDYGLRVTQTDGRECRLIFAYKDGMPHSDTCQETRAAN